MEEQWKECRTKDGMTYWCNVKTNALSATIPPMLKPAKESAGASEWAWLEDPNAGYLVVRKVKRDGAKWLVETESGEQRTVEKRSLIDATYSSVTENPPDDFAEAEEPSEPLLVNTLRKRVQNNRAIYMNVGDVLLSVNPYDDNPPYYSQYHMETYRISYAEQNMPSHIFATARDALQDLLHAEQAQNQAIVIQGLSGSGKTEAAKRVLQYIAYVSAMTNSTEADSFADKLTHASTLLEAFGNSHSSANWNSSRFGRSTELLYNAKKSLTSARITTYLFDRSRVSPKEGELNFHIFYQLLQGASDMQRQTYALDATLQEEKVEDEKSAEANSSATSRPGLNGFALAPLSKTVVNYKAGEHLRGGMAFANTTIAMQALGFTPEEQDGIFRILAAILHTGNLKFVRKNNGDADCKDTERLKIIADLLGLETKALLKALLLESVPGARNSLTQAIKFDRILTHRDLFVSALYAAIFESVVSRINQTLGSAGLNQPYTLTVVEMPGYESPEVAAASPEQAVEAAKVPVTSLHTLLANYADEKLQNLYIEQLFTNEIAIYQREGIRSVSPSLLDYPDNTVKVLSLEQPESGLFRVIEEEMRVPKSNALSLLEKARAVLGRQQTSFEEYAKNEATLKAQLAASVSQDAENAAESKMTHTDTSVPLVVPGESPEESVVAANTADTEDAIFEFKHSLGVVRYNAKGYLARNRDTIAPNLAVLMQASAIAFIQGLFPQLSPSAQLDAQNPAKASLTARATARLTQLIEKLSANKCRYVRCLRPNRTAASYFVDGGYVLSQLRYAATMALVDLRRQGYVYHPEHDVFFWRYLCAINHERPQLLKLAPRDRSARIVQALGLQSQVQVCRSLVMYRPDQHKTLELYRQLSLEEHVIRTQTAYRRFRVRSAYKVLHELIKQARVENENVNLAINQDDVHALERLVESLRSLLGRAKVALQRYPPLPKPVAEFEQANEQLRRAEIALRLEKVFDHVLDPKFRSQDVYLAASTALNEARQIEMATNRTRAVEDKISVFKSIHECERLIQDGLRLGDHTLIEKAIKMAETEKLSDVPSLPQARQFIVDLEREKEVVAEVRADVEKARGKWKGDIDERGIPYVMMKLATESQQKQWIEKRKAEILEERRKRAELEGTSVEQALAEPLPEITVPEMVKTSQRSRLYGNLVLPEDLSNPQASMSHQFLRQLTTFKPQPLRMEESRYLLALIDQLIKLRQPFRVALQASAAYAAAATPQAIKAISQGATNVTLADSVERAMPKEDAKEVSKTEEAAKKLRQAAEAEVKAWADFQEVLKLLVNQAQTAAAIALAAATNPYAISGEGVSSGAAPAGGASPGTTTTPASPQVRTRRGSVSGGGPNSGFAHHARRASIVALQDAAVQASKYGAQAGDLPNNAFDAAISATLAAGGSQEEVERMRLTFPFLPRVVAHPEIVTMIAFAKYKREEFAWREDVRIAEKERNIEALENLIQRAHEKLGFTTEDDGVLLHTISFVNGLKSVVAQAQSAIHSVRMAQAGDRAEKPEIDGVREAIRACEAYGDLQHIPAVAECYRLRQHFAQEAELVIALHRAAAAGAWINTDCKFGDYKNYASAHHIDSSNVQVAVTNLEALGVLTSEGRIALGLGYIVVQLRNKLRKAVGTQNSQLWNEIRELLLNDPLVPILRDLRRVEYDSAFAEAEFQRKLFATHKQLQTAVQKRDVPLIEEALELAEKEMQLTPEHIPMITEAKALVQRIYELRKATEDALETALDHQLEEVLAIAERLKYKDEKTMRAEQFLRLNRALKAAADNYAEEHLQRAVLEANALKMPPNSMCLSKAAGLLNAITQCRVNATASLGAFRLATAPDAKGASEALIGELRAVVHQADTLRGLPSIAEITEIRNILDQVVAEAKLVSEMYEATEQGGWLNPQVHQGDYENYVDPISIEIDSLDRIIQQARERGLVTMSGRAQFQLATMLLAVRRVMIPAVTSPLNHKLWLAVEDVLENTPGIRQFTHTTQPHPEFVAARREVDYSKEVQIALGGLRQALDSRDIDRLTAALREAARLNMQNKYHPVVGKAEELLQALKFVDEALHLAVSSLSERAMAAAIKEAEELMYTDAMNFKRCKLVHDVIVDLKYAIVRRSESELTSVLARYFALNLAPGKLSAQASALLRQMTECRARAIDVITHVMEAQQSKGITGDMVVDMEHVLKTAESLGGMNECKPIRDIANIMSCVRQERALLAPLVKAVHECGLPEEPVEIRGDYSNYPRWSSGNVRRLEDALSKVIEGSGKFLSDTKDYVLYANAVLSIRRLAVKAYGKYDWELWAKVDRALRAAEKRPAVDLYSVKMALLNQQVQQQLAAATAAASASFDSNIEEAPLVPPPVPEVPPPDDDDAEALAAAEAGDVPSPPPPMTQEEEEENLAILTEAQRAVVYNQERMVRLHDFLQHLPELVEIRRELDYQRMVHDRLNAVVRIACQPMFEILSDLKLDLLKPNLNDFDQLPHNTNYDLYIPPHGWNCAYAFRQRLVFKNAEEETIALHSVDDEALEREYRVLCDLLYELEREPYNIKLEHFENPDTSPFPRLLHYRNQAKRRINQVKEARALLNDALAEVSEPLLAEAVARGYAVAYKGPELARASKLLDQVRRILANAEEAYRLMDLDKMVKVATEAAAIDLTTDLITNIAQALQRSRGDPAAFVARQRDQAKQRGDIAEMIRLDREQFKAMVRENPLKHRFENYSELFTPVQWAQKKFISWNRKELAAGMLLYTDSSIHCALTKCSHSTRANPDEAAQEGEELFDLVLDYGHDEEEKDSQDAALKIFERIAERPDLGTELYCQIMKQLSGVPLGPVAELIRTRYWAFMGVLVRFVTPGTQEFQLCVLEFLTRHNAESMVETLLDSIFAPIPASAAAEGGKEGTAVAQTGATPTFLGMTKRTVSSRRVSLGAGLDLARRSSLSPADTTNVDAELASLIAEVNEDEETTMNPVLQNLMQRIREASHAGLIIRELSVEERAAAQAVLQRREMEAYEKSVQAKRESPIPTLASNYSPSAALAALSCVVTPGLSLEARRAATERDMQRLRCAFSGIEE